MRSKKGFRKIRGWGLGVRLYDRKRPLSLREALAKRPRCVRECRARRAIGIPAKRDFPTNLGVLKSLCNAGVLSAIDVATCASGVVIFRCLA